MKKLVLVLVLAALVAGGAFAQIEMSAGVGGILDMSFNNGVKVEGKGYFSGYSGSDGFNNTSFGAFAFFDITYAVIDVAFLSGSWENYSTGTGYKDQYTDMGTFSQLGIGIMGKFPIDLGVFKLFPMLGVNYNMVLSGKSPRGATWVYNYDYYGKKTTLSAELSQLGLLGGVGADIGITEQIFIRIEALFQLRLPMKTYSDQVKDKSEYFDSSATLGLGPRIKLSVGYKL